MFVRKLTWSAIALTALGACSDDEKAKLIDVAEATSCGNGGITIRRGVDDNENGVLDANEIDSSNDVCNAASGLVATESTTAGTDGCTFGGTRILSGLDNGDGGGTAGNGTLEPGEIDETRTVCQSEGFYARSVELPSGADGANTFLTVGGTATNGNGGSAGSIRVEADNGSLGGHVKVFRNGVAPVTVAAPSVTPSFGPVPMLVQSNLTVDTVADASTLPANTFYRSPGGALLFWNGTTSVTPTGLQVAAGVTLSFAGTDGVAANFPFDVDIAGSITLRNGNDGRDLGIDARTVVLRAGSTIDLSGVDGGDGGQLVLRGNTTGSAVILAGAVNLGGGAGASGGDGGTLEASVYRGALHAVGSIVTSGGAGSAGGGGNGGGVAIGVNYGSVVAVGGTVTMRGGDGTTTAGNGGAFMLGNAGRVDLAAAVDLSGGNGATGGNAGPASLEVGGGLHVAGSVVGRGGSGTAANGGSGSSVAIYIFGGDGYQASGVYVGDTTFAANIDLSGGAGVTGGGSGGTFDLQADYDENAFGQEVVFYGVPVVDTRGGVGSARGGDGGSVYFGNMESDTTSGAVSGGVFVTSDVTTSGGNGGTDTGGNAGYIDFETTYDADGATNPNTRVVSTGALTANGGNGTFGGTMAGNFFFNGLRGVEIRGPMTSNGGNGTAGNGGPGAGLEIFAERGLAQIATTISLNGGTGTVTGGSPYSFTITGESVSCAGEWSMTGGAGGTGNGGDGAIVTLVSGTSNMTLDPNLTVVVAGGPGTTEGVDGFVYADGSDVTAAVAD